MKKNLIIKCAVFVSVFFAAGLFPSKAYSSGDEAPDQLKVLTEIMTLVQDKYAEPTQTKDLIYGAARGIVKELDEYSQFMPPDAYDKHKTVTTGEFGGVGMRIQSENGYVTVITPLPNSPAFAAGIMPGDRIIKIDDENIQNVNLDDAAKKLKGAPGTKVKLTVLRTLKDKNKEIITKNFEMTREKIVQEVSFARLFENNIGYIYIKDFSAHSHEEAAKHIERLKASGMQALILDLRFNPGGLLTSTVETGKLFLKDNKMIVFTKGRSAESYQEFRSALTAPYADIPLVVLVNGASMSGSEIVAGAIKDNKRGLIIGERTFGKANVQTALPLSDGSALKLTTSQYYTPSGSSIQRNPKAGTGGIIPDIEVKGEPDLKEVLMKQYDKIYTPGAEESKMIVEKVENDAALLKAVETLKIRNEQPM